MTVYDLQSPFFPDGEWVSFSHRTLLLFGPLVSCTSFESVTREQLDLLFHFFDSRKLIIALIANFVSKY